MALNPNHLICKCPETQCRLKIRRKIADDAKMSDAVFERCSGTHPVVSAKERVDSVLVYIDGEWQIIVLEETCIPRLGKGGVARRSWLFRKTKIGSPHRSPKVRGCNEQTSRDLPGVLCVFSIGSLRGISSGPGLSEVEQGVARGATRPPARGSLGSSLRNLRSRPGVGRESAPRARVHVEEVDVRGSGMPKEPPNAALSTE